MSIHFQPAGFKSTYAVKLCIGNGRVMNGQFRDLSSMTRKDQFGASGIRKWSLFYVLIDRHEMRIVAQVCIGWVDFVLR